MTPLMKKIQGLQPPHGVRSFSTPKLTQTSNTETKGSKITIYKFLMNFKLNYIFNQKIINPSFNLKSLNPNFKKMKRKNSKSNPNIKTQSIN